MFKCFYFFLSSHTLHKGMQEYLYYSREWAMHIYVIAYETSLWWFGYKLEFYSVLSIVGFLKYKPLSLLLVVFHKSKCKVIQVEISQSYTGLGSSRLHGLGDHTWKRNLMERRLEEAGMHQSWSGPSFVFKQLYSMHLFIGFTEWWHARP